MAKKPTKQPERVSDRLRKAVNESGMTQYRICQLAEIEPAAMSRFMHGTGLNLESIDRLCNVLGLRLVADKPTTQRKGK